MTAMVLVRIMAWNMYRFGIKSGHIFGGTMLKKLKPIAYWWESSLKKSKHGLLKFLIFNIFFH